jgi:hypothetical protein
MFDGSDKIWAWNAVFCVLCGIKFMKRTQIFSEGIFISGEYYIINVVKDSFHVKIYQEM